MIVTFLTTTDRTLTIYMAAYYGIRRLILLERARPCRWLGVSRLIGNSGKSNIAVA
jgi:hypothetical protein